MKIRTISLVVATLLLLVGCAPAMNGSTEQAMGDDEQMFAQMMIPHHEQALEMAELVPERTTNPEILEISRKIAAGQEPEIALMQAWLGEHAGHGDQGDHAGHGGMDGMLTEAELETLAAASGAEFDRLFLEGMIKHHEGALEMLSLLDGSENAEALELRQQIETTQLAEIAQMKELLSGY